MYQQPTDAIDVPYEPYSDNYSHSQTSSSNTGWSGRSKNVYGRASSYASNYTRGITPAMESGAGAAIGTIGTVASHSNPFKPWCSIAFWSMGVGFVTVIGWIGSAVLGGFIAARNPRPLPSNAPNAMRFGHGLVRVGTPVAGGVKSAAMVSQGVGSRAGKKIKGRKRFISVDTMVSAATRRLVTHKHQTPNLDGDFEKNFLSLRSATLEKGQ
ncbi:MAG: hypothetical protein VKL59_10040 [Nostocaceae cyanobacterium]|nr:hypothetical protein [Nostocaceae cyanobacterium]